MGHHHHDQTVPRGALIGAGVLLLATFVLAAGARQARLAEPDPVVVVERSIDLQFEDRSDGAVVVLDAHTEREVEVVPPAQGGFIRGVMRGMNRTRKLESIPADRHFRLMELDDGALILEDPHSGRKVDLRSFGETNHQAFARLLESGGSPS